MITIILVVAVLRWSYPVTMPLVVAIFIIAAAPPVAIIVALVFWAWIWGIAGALLAVPLTAALLIVCQHFKSTARIARLLARSK